MCQVLGNVGITNHFNFLLYIYLQSNFISKGTDEGKKSCEIHHGAESAGWWSRPSVSSCVCVQGTLPAARHRLFCLLDLNLMCVVLFDLRESSCGQGPGAAPVLPGTCWSWGGDRHTPSPPTNGIVCLGGWVGGSFCKGCIPLPCRPLVSQPWRRGSQLAKTSRATHESYWVWVGPGTCHSLGWKREVGHWLSQDSLAGHLALPLICCVAWACDFPPWGPVSSVDCENGLIVWTGRVTHVKLKEQGWGPVKC